LIRHDIHRQIKVDCFLKIGIDLFNHIGAGPSFHGGLQKLPHTAFQIFECTYPEPVEELLIQFGRLEFLDFLDNNLHIDFPAAESLIKIRLRHLNGNGTLLAAFGSFQQFHQPLYRYTGGKTWLPHKDFDIILLIVLFDPFDMENNIGDNLVPFFHSFFFLGHPQACAFPHRLNFFFHLLVGHFNGGLSDFDAFQIRQFKLRPHLNLKTVNHRPAVRQLDLFVVNIRLAERINLIFLEHLLGGLSQQLEFDLIANIHPKPLLEQPKRSSTAAKTGYRRIPSKFFVFCIQKCFYFLFRDFDRYLFLAGTYILHFHYILDGLRRFGLGLLIRLGFFRHLRAPKLLLYIFLQQKRPPKSPLRRPQA